MCFLLYGVFQKARDYWIFLTHLKTKKKNYRKLVNISFQNKFYKYLKTDGVVCYHVNYSVCTVDSLQSVGQKSSLLIMGQGNEFIICELICLN